MRLAKFRDTYGAWTLPSSTRADGRWAGMKYLGAEGGRIMA
jgi:hypothetical protein